MFSREINVNSHEMNSFMLADWKPRKRLHHFSTCSYFSMYRVIGVGWGGDVNDALAHMFDATQEHRLR